MTAPRKTDPDYLLWRFIRAIQSDSWPVGEKLLGQHPELANTVSPHGIALEVVLRRSKRLGPVRALLAAGADPNLRDPDRPWFSPLRTALQRSPDAVPLLLEAGAKPSNGHAAASMFNNRYSDLHLAITHCPQHIPALEQAGARFDEKDANGQYPISVLMQTLLGNSHPFAVQDDKLRWSVFKEWASRENAWEDEAHHTPAWFHAWSLLWKAPVYCVTPPDHEEVCWSLVSQETHPGRRFRGQTFLHAIAKSLRRDFGFHTEAIAKWDVLPSRYSAAQLQEWSRVEPGRDVGLPLLVELIPSPNDSSVERLSATDRQEHFFQCLEWLKRFSAIGADANEKTHQGKCLFQVMLEQVSAQWLQDGRVLETLKQIGYDPRLSANPEELKKLFASKVAAKRTVWQAAEELENLVEGWWLELTLPSASPVASRSRPRV